MEPIVRVYYRHQRAALLSLVLARLRFSSSLGHQSLSSQGDPVLQT